MGARVAAEPWLSRSGSAQPARFGRRECIVHPRVWRALVVGGVAAIIGSLALAPGSRRGLIFDVFGVAAAAAILIGVRQNRPAEPLPWHLIAAGAFVTVVGRVT